ncbi:MAG: anaerobic ribonucleoside-triphosphate reductase activating protein [Exiguobacterium sp.]|nr:anaerobic ribonucleoside-triphosphate reductase activating protein [Exiguobacterium sp.]
MSDLSVQLAGIIEESVVDGPGVRFVIFTQGCPRSCPGCQNPETQSTCGGYSMQIDRILEMIRSNPLLRGVTFSGGEPFMQAGPLAELAKEVHQMGLSVMVYSGYRYEDLVAGDRTDWNALLSETDVLVDGPYVESQRSLALLFRGSANQRLIDVPKSLKQRHAIISSALA